MNLSYLRYRARVRFRLDVLHAVEKYCHRIREDHVVLTLEERAASHLSKLQGRKADELMQYLWTVPIPDNDKSDIIQKAKIELGVILSYLI